MNHVSVRDVFRESWLALADGIEPLLSLYRWAGLPGVVLMLGAFGVALFTALRWVALRWGGDVNLVSNREISAALGFFASLWPAFTGALFVNQKIGVYLPEADTIIITILNTLILWILAIPGIVVAVGLMIAVRNASLRWVVAVADIGVSMFWLAVCIVGAGVLWAGITPAGNIMLIHGGVIVWLGSKYLKVAYRRTRAQLKGVRNG